MHERKLVFPRVFTFIVRRRENCGRFFAAFVFVSPIRVFSAESLERPQSQQVLRPTNKGCNIYDLHFGQEAVFFPGKRLNNEVRLLACHTFFHSFLLSMKILPEFMQFGSRKTIMMMIPSWKNVPSTVKNNKARRHVLIIISGEKCFEIFRERFAVEHREVALFH